MSVHVGEIDQRVVIQRLTLTPDGSGGNVKSWTELATVWCHVRPKSGRESVGSDRVEGSASYLFVIRYRAGLRDSDRIVWKGVSYNIRAIHDRSGRRLYLDLEAERGVAQ
jgi:SPP1 family predicted phage head-tail adaptor